MDDDRSAPATKADLSDLEVRLTESLTEAIRDSQTEILKAFYGIEKRLNMPPAA